MPLLKSEGLFSGEEGGKNTKGYSDEGEPNGVVETLQHNLLEQVLGYTVDESFGEEADIPAHQEYATFHAYFPHFPGEFWEYLLHDILEDLDSEGNGGEVLEIVGHDNILDELHHEPECLLLGELVDEQETHQVVHALAVEQGGVSDGVGVQHILEVGLQGVVVRHGPGDVLVDAAEEQLGVLSCLRQQVGVVPRVVQLAVVGLAGDHHEIFVVVLRQMPVQVNLVELLPPPASEHLLLMAQSLQHVRNIQRLNIIFLFAFLLSLVMGRLVVGMMAAGVGMLFFGWGMGLMVEYLLGLGTEIAFGKFFLCDCR